jgi:hypothetical protein
MFGEWIRIGSWQERRALVNLARFQGFACLADVVKGHRVLVLSICIAQETR